MPPHLPDILARLLTRALDRLHSAPVGCFSRGASCACSLALFFVGQSAGAGICALLLLAYAVTAAGVPISIGSSPEKSGEIFPCMASSCGCRTADQCWRSCCCHSMTERLAWARKRGIEPPAVALAQARTAGLDLTLITTVRDSCDDESSCCRSDSLVTDTSGKDNSCCSDHSVQAASSNDREGHIVAWRALACRGQSMNWLAAVPNMIIERPDVSLQTPLIGWLGPASSDVAGGESHDPAVPPPESA